MAKTRRYQLLCPIARALDRIGDRWTLLIIRDLQAGPARFSDLQSSFKGMASNLLTDRLRQLVADKLVARRQAAFGVTVYELTDIGMKTSKVLYELAAFGSQFPPDENPKRPGNLRTMVVTLREAVQRVIMPEQTLKAGLIVDGESFAITVGNGEVQVEYQTTGDADVVVVTSYEPMMAAGDGRMNLDEFAANHISIQSGSQEQAMALLGLLGKAMASMMP